MELSEPHPSVKKFFDSVRPEVIRGTCGHKEELDRLRAYIADLENLVCVAYRIIETPYYNWNKCDIEDMERIKKFVVVDEATASTTPSDIAQE